MAGRPVLDRLNAAIEEAGGDEMMFDQVAAGKPIGEIMEPWGVSRQMFYAWLDSREGRREKYEEAKRQSADAHVEEAHDILMGANPKQVHSAQVSMLKAQVGFKKWLAAKRNPEEYGEQNQQIDFNINLNDFHLEALQKHGGREIPGEKEVEADYEVLESGQESSPRAEDEFEAVEAA